MNKECVVEGQRATVICGFPGIGKSEICRYGIGRAWCKDSDSSNYSWLDKEHKVRNPDFPKNYIEHIKSEIWLNEYIFVSSHKVVRDALVEAKIPFICVYPDKEDKPRYMTNYFDRGNTPEFIKLMDGNFEKWIDEINLDNSIKFKWQLPRGWYLNDFIENVLNWTSSYRRFINEK